MKRILSTLFCLLLIVAAFAQNTNEHLKFMGIPIAGTLSQFQAKLIAKGCKVNKQASAYSPNGQRVLNGTFAGKKANIIIFYDTKSKLVYRAKAILNGISEDMAEQEYNSFKNLLYQKYGDKHTYLHTKDYKESITFLVTKPGVGDDIDFENLENISDVAYGTIDVFILKDTEDWMRDPYNYNLHIDYNDVLSNIKHNEGALNDL